MTPNAATLRFGTWNVREGLPDRSSDLDDRPRSLSELAATIDSLGVDVIALQEVDFGPDGSSAVLEAVTSRTKLKYTTAVVLSNSTFFPGCSAGIALASRWPLHDRGSIMLPNPGFTVEHDGREIELFDKGLIAATVRVDGLALTAVSVHVFPFVQFGHRAEESRLANVWAAIGSALDKYEEHLALGGDFNTDRRDLLFNAAKRRLSSVMGTIPTHRGRALDDIVCSGEMLVGDPIVVDGFSDHQLCLADLTLRPSNV